MTSPMAETIKTQLRELNQSELVEIQELIEYLLENFVKDDEDDLPLKPKFQERLERFQRGDYTTMNFDEAMKGEDWAGLFRLRVGDYRVIYSLDHENHTLTVTGVGHRKDVYDK